VKIGIPIWYGSGDIAAAIKKAVNLGFDYVEISLDYPYPEKIGKKDIDAIKNSPIGLAFHAPYAEVFLGHPSEIISKAALAKFQQCLDFVSNFETLYLDFHQNIRLPTVNFPEINREVYATALAGIERILNYSKEKGMRFPIVLENNSFPYFHSTESLGRALRNKDLQFCMDIGHASMLSFKTHGKIVEEEVIKLIQDFKEKILVSHLHNVNLWKNECIDHLPLTNGILNLERIIDEIRKTNSKYFLLEIFYNDLSKKPADGLKFKENKEYLLSLLR